LSHFYGVSPDAQEGVGGDAVSQQNHAYITWRNKGSIMQKTHTVWVGGVEVNDYYLSQPEAQALADSYIAQGYDDVHIECIEN